MRKLVLQIVISLSIGASLCLSLWQWWVVSAQNETVDFPYDVNGQARVPVQDASTEIAKEINNDAVKPTTGILDRLTKYFRVSGTAYNPDNTWSPALGYVQWIINILLGLVSLIALVLIIFAFYLIFFAKQEEAIKKATKILIWVAIALGLMGLSWFIVSFFFDVVRTQVR